MQNNQISKIAIGSESHKKARFNLSHDVNSTYQFGEVQPVLFRDMIAGEKDVVDITSLVRMSPMVAPTFGRILHREWHHFIPWSDLFPHYGEFLAQRSYNGQLPTNLPQMSLGYLSYMTLVGAKMSIYVSDDSSANPDPELAEYTLYRAPSVSETTSDIDGLLTHIAHFQQITSPNYPFDFRVNASSAAWHVTNSCMINLRYLMNPTISYIKYGLAAAFRQNLFIPTGNWSTNSWFDFVDKTVDFDDTLAPFYDFEVVDLDSADAVIPYYIEDGSYKRTLLLAFKFSNFGKRIYKILTGLGYTLDFESTQSVSLMPIFAFYKAWFDSFGITRNKSWSDTSCYALLRKFDFAPSNYNFDQVFDQNVGEYYSLAEWNKFMFELGNAFVTEDVDYVSAHTWDNPSVVTSVDESLKMFDGVPNPNSYHTDLVREQGNEPNAGPQTVPALKLSNDSSISALDVKQLMQMYRWINRDSVAGRAVEDALRVQGYGYFLYSSKSNFIGFTEQPVQVYDVVSSSDTFNSDDKSGALLGQYAGRGLSTDKSRTMSFVADEEGAWIGLCAIIPKSGYSEALSPQVTAVTKFQRYNPQFDGKYYTLTPKSAVHGNKPFSELYGMDTLKDPFGFIPIYTGFKIAQNISNGGFSLRSQRKVFQPYMLDKVIDVGSRDVTLVNQSSSSFVYGVRKMFRQLPNAGEYWRYVGRYQWMSDYNRIFASILSEGEKANIRVSTADVDDYSFSYVIFDDDNFMIHHVVNQIAYAPMLPIEQSFDTEDSEEKFDTSVDFA